MADPTSVDQGVTILAVQFAPEYVEITYADTDQNGGKVQVVHQVIIPAGVVPGAEDAVVDVQETLAEVLQEALVVARNPPASFSRPR